MTSTKFTEYAKNLRGMERIELVLDLLIEKKITKDQATVLIANDKLMHPPVTTTPPYYTQPYQISYPVTVFNPSDSATSTTVTTTAG